MTLILHLQSIHLLSEHVRETTSDSPTLLKQAFMVTGLGECNHHEFLCIVLSCTCDGIHPGRVEPASPTELTTSRIDICMRMLNGCS